MNQCKNKPFILVICLILVLLISNNEVRANQNEEQNMINHTLKIQSTDGGSVIPEPGIYTVSQGTEIRLDIIPEKGYTFVGWEGDIDILITESLIKVTKNATLTAIFATDETPSQDALETNEESTIEDDGLAEDEEIEILDEPIPVTPMEKLPNTGGNNDMNGIYAWGIGLISIALLFFKKKKKRFARVIK